MENPLKANEWERMCVRKTFVLETQKEWPNNSDPTELVPSRN